MTRKYYIAAILLTAAALAATALAYPHLPGSIARHWGLNGRPNGYSPKWTLYGFPAGMAVFILLVWKLPQLSPRHFEVDTFRPTYLQIMLIVVALLAYSDAIILWTNLGHTLDMGRWAGGAVCLIFVLLGNLMGKVRRNFYIGVRTPWTLASERVWYATHRLAAKTFVLGGLSGLILVAFNLGVWLLAALLAGGLIPVVYSFYFYKQLERRNEL